MRFLPLLILLLHLLLLHLAAHAELPAEILVSDSSFDFHDMNTLMMESFKIRPLARALVPRLPPDISWNEEQAGKHLNSAMPMDELPLRTEFYRREGFDEPTKSASDKARIKERFEAYKRELGYKLKSHFEQAFRAAGGTVRKLESGHRLYRLPNGIQFYHQLLSASDPDLRKAADCFLNSAFRISSKAGAEADVLVRHLAGYQQGLTRLVDAADFSDTDWNRILEIAGERNLKASRHGKYVLIGSGPSFHLTDELLHGSGDIKTDLLQRRFDKVLRFLQQKGLPFEKIEHQGAAAAFSPVEFKVGYIIPGSIDLNAVSHEVTHARFRNFQEVLSRWVARNNFAVPYEIDGPPTPGLTMLFKQYGGFMELLDELNSWRIGEAFDGKGSDPEILQTLKDYYGRQAGTESVTRFMEVWTAGRVKGQSVPQLILNSVRAFNRLTPKELYEMGNSGIAGDDEILQMNFLRLFRKRYQDQTPPPELEAIRGKLERQGSTEQVRTLASGTTSKKSPSGARITASEFFALKAIRTQLEAATAPWMERLQKQYTIIPRDLGNSAYLYDLARRENIQDFGHLIKRARKLKYPLEIMDVATAKRVFTEMMNRKGKTADQKINSWLKTFNERGFDAVWSEYQKAPGNSDLAALIFRKWGQPGGPVSSRHLQELFELSLLPNDSASMHGPMDLLTAILETHGFLPLITDHAYEQDVQQALKSGRSAPTRRDLTRKPALLDSALDQFLADRLFDGNPGADRLKVVNLIQERFSPDDLPVLFGKIRTTLANARQNLSDFWVARAFLMPEDREARPTKHLWGKRIADVIMSDPTPSESAQNVLAEFYRLSVARSLPDHAELSSGPLVLDQKARTTVTASLRKMNPEQKKDYQLAVRNLFRLFLSENPKASKGARYAMRAYPAYLLGVEDMITREMKTRPAPELRLKAAQLAAMTDGGFLPRIEAAFSEITPTPIEQEYLNLMGWRQDAMRKCLINGLVAGQR